VIAIEAMASDRPRLRRGQICSGGAVLIFHDTAEGGDAHVTITCNHFLRP